MKRAAARKPDRRVQRTHQLLRGALLSLIREKGFEALTVQDIIDRANVGRATFYAHFDNKEDLLVSGFEDLRASLEARQRDARARGRGADERVFAFSRDMFAHANEYREVFHVMAGKRSGAAVQRLLHKLLLDLVRADVAVLAELDATAPTTPRRSASSAPAEALAQFIAGGFVALLFWWMDPRIRVSVDEIDARFRRLAIPALKAALG